ncbi:MAG TPA: NAD-dependent epimerase/dehydratase family protein [Gemmatimonadota bacterium]|nr:NAD-dependent epimerase/dehydratase family protein [Gemmatimonadota bacterium]
MERVLVTGGAGFIGSHVADRFIAEGCEVTVLDDLSTGRRERVPQRASFVEMGLDDPVLDDVFAEKQFDTVSHHAAQIDVRISVEDPIRDARTNVTGLLNVLERARRHRVDRVVYASSGGVVYGEPSVVPTPEGHAKRPLSPYGVGKLAGEHYLLCYGAVHGLECAALRYSNVYGPRQDPHGEAGVVAIFGRRILRSEPVMIFGDGEQERDYVFVHDVVQANWLASTIPLPQAGDLDARAWNIGTGRGTSVNELAELLMRIAGREVERLSAPERPGEVARSVLECSRAAAELGWRAETELEQGLKQTMEHLNEESR